MVSSLQVRVHVAVVGLVIALHHLSQLSTLSQLHCPDVSAEMDARSLHIIGFSHSRTERSASTGGKIPAPLRTTSRKPAGGRVSLPGRRIVDVGVPSSRSSSSHFFFLLGFFPAAGTSYFFTFSADASDSLSMECTDPMNFDTHNPNCSVVLPQGAVAFCGTTSGVLIRWNIRSLLCSNICSLWSVYCLFKYANCELERRFYVGARGHRPPKSCPGPPNFWTQ